MVVLMMNRGNYTVSLWVILLSVDSILTIYDRSFTRFGLTMAYTKTETMAFNVSNDIKQWESWLSIKVV